MLSERKKVILINGIFGLASQAIEIICQFVLRIFVLQYIGVEIVGVSSTIMSILKTLSLAELGFQTTIVYYLYTPLRTKNIYKTNQIMQILKKVYELVGVIFIFFTIITIPMLGIVLKGIEISGEILLIYLFMSINNACTYFFAYKRAIFFADQKQYVTKFIDSIFNVIINIIVILSFLIVKSYVAVVVLQTIQTVGTNIFIQVVAKKYYPYLKKEKFDIEIFKIIFKDVKNVFVGKIAGYVYGATDNLIISSYMGAIYVGYLSNYTVFIAALKRLINALFNAMTPIIGNMLLDKSCEKEKEKTFQIYSSVRYLLASIVIVPWVLLANDLITIFFGEQYILSNWIVILISADLYIHIVYSGCVEYINGSGKFNTDKKIAVVGMIINLIISISSIKNWGIEGVLFGTLISQLFFWIGRSWVVYFKVFKMEKLYYVKYWIINILKIAMVIIALLLSSYIKVKITTENKVITCIINFFICEIINLVIQLVDIIIKKMQRKGYLIKQEI